MDNVKQMVRNKTSTIITRIKNNQQRRINVQMIHYLKSSTERSNENMHTATEGR